MKITLLSDLHFPDNIDEFNRIVGKLRGTVVIAGDITSTGKINEYEKFLKVLFKKNKNLTLIHTLGNHEYWLSRSQMRKNMNSLEKINRFKEIADDYGVHILNFEPVMLGKVAFIGNVGWYDYSFAEHLNFDEVLFERGTPYKNCCIPPCSAHDRVCPEWSNDAVYVKLPMSNKEFVKKNAERIKKHAEEVSHADRIYVVFHHIPKRELISYTGDRYTDFFRAYDGSDILGKAVEELEVKVDAVFYGHTHTHRKRSDVINGIKYIALSYKFLETLD